MLYLSTYNQIKTKFANKEKEKQKLHNTDLHL